MKRTLLTGIVAAVIALGAGVFVAGAADHATFASSSSQNDRGGFRGGPPPGGQFPPRPNS